MTAGLCRWCSKPTKSICEWCLKPLCAAHAIRMGMGWTKDADGESQRRVICRKDCVLGGKP